MNRQFFILSIIIITNITFWLYWDFNLVINTFLLYFVVAPKIIKYQESRECPGHERQLQGKTGSCEGRLHWIENYKKWKMSRSFCILELKAACTLAENRAELGDFLIGRSFLEVKVFGLFANLQKNQPKSSLFLIKNLPKIGCNNQSERTVH